MMIKVMRRSIPDFPKLGLGTVLDQIYASRGVQSLDELDRSLRRLLPYQHLSHIQSATQLLYQALESQKRILVIGDYDADGATSSALAVSALKAFGAEQVDFLVPNRFEHGYGLTPVLIQLALERKAELIITVDNGISSCSAASLAREYGIQLLITDHHLPGEELPNADVIVNPQLAGDLFPSKNLAGVGVIFYVMLALRAELKQRGWFQAIPEPNMAQFLDLVALGTVADLVPLDHNNRIMVYQGLGRMIKGELRPGIQALIQVSGRDRAHLTAADLGFLIAPRLNAAGRLADMSLGVSCLLSPQLEPALAMAEQLNQLNQERRAIEKDMKDHAFKLLSHLEQRDFSTTAPRSLCLFDQSWHSGVIGLLASRVKDRWQKPTIIFAQDGPAELKGSARSVPGLHIRDSLAAIAIRFPELIIKFGGHAMAAGLSIKPEYYEHFCTAFEQEVQQRLTDHYQVIYTDGLLQDFSLTLAEAIRSGGPWGQGFPEPIFEGRFKILDQRLLRGGHLRLSLQAESSSEVLNAIMFQVEEGAWPNHRADKVFCIYRLDINYYQNKKELQLIIEEIELVAKSA